ncbi:MAG: N-acetylneuraminate synthase [Bacteroidetes bacterium GWF2_49_14]|nr:MAG: N-acetylneuraminate synthase [Bacteroidetes bacterium GWF2_49_14]HBB91098.1 N-acetylneuraminate synthase [Bacteroidales bacterium]
MKKRVMIIAEAGVNHNGSLERAFRMIDAAASAGADIIKFQSFKTEKLVTADAPKAAYQQSNTGETGSQFGMLKKLELAEDAHVLLMNYCREKGITFMSTPFDADSAGMLNRLEVEMFKVGSGDLTNLPLLRQLAGFGKPVILSTGMADMDEIGKALEVVIKGGLPKEKITVLHANTDYPTPYSDVNLTAMLAIKRKFGVTIGYSDHTDGIEVPVAAVALGAQVIEKHFTLDRNLEGPDHKASLEPAELTAMVRSIRNIEIALGNGKKIPSAGERKNMAAARKSIVAAGTIYKGELFTEENLTVKRPGTGICPLRWDQIIGTFALRDYRKDELI